MVSSRLIGGLGAALLTASLLGPVVAGTSGAAPPRKASVTVTIQSEGTDIFGEVRSSKPRRCAADRTVKLFKMVDGEPHLFASDTTGLQGGRWVWSTGNTGTEGRFFAKVAAKPGCRPDSSPTITVRRNP